MGVLAGIWGFITSPFGRVLLIVAAVGGALWWIDHRGYERAMNERDRLDANARLEWQGRVIEFETMLDDEIAELERSLGTRIAAIDATGRTVVNPVIEREIIREARFSDPALGISDGMRDALNAARAESARPAAPVGRAADAVPAARPAGR